MQILIDREGQEAIRLTKTEQRILRRAAQLMRQVARGADNSYNINGHVSGELEGAAKEYGPKETVTA